MDHLSIPIPEGLDDRQKADLAGWLSEQAREAAGKRLPIEDDPAFHAEAVPRIKRGMKDAEAGKVLTSNEARRRIAGKYGFAEPE
jgi:hypothetical protein